MIHPDCLKSEATELKPCAKSQQISVAYMNSSLLEDHFSTQGAVGLSGERSRSIQLHGRLRGVVEFGMPKDTL